MNRRNARFFLLATFSLGVVGVFVGREMASWRPVKVAPQFAPGKIGDTIELSVSNRAVVQVTEETSAPFKTSATLFDIQTEKLQKFSFPKNDETGMSNTIGVQNDFFWQENLSPFSLEIVDGANHKKNFVYEYPVSSLNHKILRVLPEHNRVVVLDVFNILQWNFKNQKLEVESGIQAFARGGGNVVGDFSLSRDGRFFIHAGRKRILVGDTSTGETTRTTPLTGTTFYESAILSPYGQYAFYDQNGAPFRWEVVETATGKRLWGFNIPPIVSPLWAIADDEQNIIIPANKQWEVRDLKTGALLRRLPFVPGTRVAASSPDGATLYSVANGVLYQQRAR